MDGDYMLMYFDGLNKFERPYYLRGHVSKEKAQEVLAYEEEITVKSVAHKYGRSIRVSPDHEEAIDGLDTIFRVIDTPRRSYYPVTECEPLLPFNATVTATAMVQKWAQALPEMEVVLGGSLVNGLAILVDGQPVDMDVRFLSDDLSDTSIERIEEVTGLKFRKTIKVADYPSGFSDGHMVEGNLEVDGTLFEVEACLRNRSYVGWGKYYTLVLSDSELKKFREDKERLMDDKTAYKAAKAAMLKVVQSRVLEQGLL